MQNHLFKVLIVVTLLLSVYNFREIRRHDDRLDRMLAAEKVIAEKLNLLDFKQTDGRNKEREASARNEEREKMVRREYDQFRKVVSERRKDAEKDIEIIFQLADQIATLPQSPSNQAEADRMYMLREALNAKSQSVLGTLQALWQFSGGSDKAVSIAIDAVRSDLESTLRTGIFSKKDVSSTKSRVTERVVDIFEYVNGLSFEQFRIKKAQ